DQLAPAGVGAGDESGVAGHPLPERRPMAARRRRLAVGLAGQEGRQRQLLRRLKGFGMLWGRRRCRVSSHCVTPRGSGSGPLSARRRVDVGTLQGCGTSVYGGDAPRLEGSTGRVGDAMTVLFPDRGGGHAGSLSRMVGVTPNLAKASRNKPFTRSRCSLVV